MSPDHASNAATVSVDAPRSRPDAARRLGQWAYVGLALGLVLYIVAIWFEVYVDTRNLASVPRDLCAESHRRWRLRTAFVVLVWSVLGGLTLPFGVGWFVLIPAYAWYVYRVVRGVAWFALGRPIGVPRTRPDGRVTQGNRT